MRVLMVGDTHGRQGWAKYVARFAAKNDCEWIMQLGDFGVFPHIGWGRVYLDSIEQLVDHFGIPWRFLDGNHDNHRWLRKLEFDEDGIAEVRPGLDYASRGSRWTWNGVRFLALGGALSIDRDWRTEGHDWWPEELITDAEVERAIAGGPTDVLLSHDCASGVPVLGSHHDEDWLYFPASERNRERLLSVAKATRPKYAFHGHFHVRHSSPLDLPLNIDGELVWHRVQVEGLGCHDMIGKAYVIVDLAKLSEEVGVGA